MSNKLQVAGEEWQMTTEEQRAIGLDAQPPSQKPPEPKPLQMRQLSLYGLIALVFAIFFARLFYLQVMRGAYFTEKAQINRNRLVQIDAPRGIIYDRSGTPLVRNIPDFSVTIVPAYLPDDDLAEMEVYRKLSLLLNMPISTQSASTIPSGGGGPGIKDIVDKAVKEGQNFRPILISNDIPREMAMVIAEQTMKLPGVQMQVNAMRLYPSGSLLSQVLGYVGAIPEQEAQDYEDKGYDRYVDRVGLTGIEWVAESYLKGTKGRKYIEEDVAGREISIVGEPDPPAPGNNVYLSIDAGLQQVAAEALQAQINQINRIQGVEQTQSGAAIAMNPQTGQILAMVSLPSYDNNLFTQGISQTAYQAYKDDIYRPLFNHAIGDQVQPGSIFKMIPASAALEEKVITPRTIINDPGTIVIPNKYYPNDPGQGKRLTCWLKSGHGNMDLLHGLAYSCDVYFWQVGAGYDVPNQPRFDGLGIDRLVKYSQMFGLGELTSVDLPGEAKGHVPTTTWYRRTYGQTWATGDTYNFAIGQGYLLATPLQMLNVTAAVANGGTLYKPQIIDHITDLDGAVVRAFKPQPKPLHIDVKLENLQLVQQGMEAAVMWGTATGAQVPGIRVAGKTGTAEFCDDVAVKLGFCATGRVLPQHAWFVSFAPVENPQIATIVYIYNGGQGSEQAVPVTKKMLDYYFGRTKPTS